MDIGNGYGKMRARVLLMAANAFFVASVVLVHAGHKRVIIRVPQRTKHIYHHQVKKVPVYVLLPEKKSKVLDDLEDVTKVLPCREREREPPWQDEIAAGPPPAPSKYRYARHYDRIRDAGDVDVDSYDTASIWQQDTKRSLQPPAPQQQRQQQQQQQQQQKPRLRKSARQSAAHHRAVASVPANYEKYNDEADIGGGGGGIDSTSATIIRSSAPAPAPASLFQKNVRDAAVDGDGGDDRKRYAGYYQYERDYKSLPRSTAASLSKSNSDSFYDDGRSNNPIPNANRNSFASVDVQRLAGGGNEHVGQNFIRISYPSSPLSASADSPFYPSAAGDAATSHHSSADRNQRRPQLPSATASSNVPVAAVDNYASSYQYKIQH